MVPETKVATFECEVSHSGVPSVWLKDGQQVEMSEKFSVVTTGKVHQLKVVDCSRDDSAEYTFVCGDDRVSAKLTVDRKLLPSPFFFFFFLLYYYYYYYSKSLSFFPAAVVVTAPLQDVNTQEKDTVTLEVGVNFEEISYRWLKNGVEIRSTDRCQARCRQRTHTLSIRNVHFGDSADYTFVAGSARTSAKVYVEGEMVASSASLQLA